jgi:hypothetical protein
MSGEMVGGGDPYLPHDPPHTRLRSGPYPRWSAGIRQYPRGGRLISVDLLIEPVKYPGIQNEYPSISGWFP